MQEIQPAPYAEIAVPPALGQRLQHVFGLERVPHILGDLVGLFGRTGTEIDQTDLWAPAPTAHAVQTAGPLRLHELRHGRDHAACDHRAAG